MNDPIFTDEGPEYYAAAYKRNQQFAKSGPYTTALTPQEERSFRQWVKSKGVPFDPSEKVSDYDMRGFWKENHKDALNWKKGSHFPDTFKTPYDTTFSNESKYATKDNPNVWKGDNLVDKRTGQVIFGSKMPNIQGLPAGATVEPLDTAAAGIPAGATVEPISGDDSNSVMAPKQSFFDRAKGLVKSAAPVAAQVGIPIAAGMALGPEAGIAARMGVGALSGAAGAGAADVLRGQKPSVGDMVTGAIWNAGGEGLGAAVGKSIQAIKGKAPEVAESFEGVNPKVRTGKQIDAAVKRKDLLKQAGFSDQEITQLTASPEAMAALDRNINYAEQTKANFQQAVDVRRADITDQINTAIGKYKGAEVPVGTVGSAINQNLGTLGQQQASPGLKSFLQSKAAEFGGGGPTIPPDIDRQFVQQSGGDPQLLERIRQNYLQSLPPTAPKSLSIDDLQKFHDELWDHYPRGQNANAVDQKLIVNISKASENQLDTGLKAAGASNEQIAEYHAARQDWHRFKEVVSTFDPRGKNFGNDVANALFGQTAKNPDEALYFAKMVSAADKVNPGVKQQFAHSWLEHFLGEANGESGTIGQLETFAKFRREFSASGKKGTGQAFLNEVFGKGSPLANESKFSQVVGKYGDPKVVAAAQNAVRTDGRQGNVQWLVRYAAILGGTNIAHQALGQGKFKGGIFSVITDPTGWAVVGGYMMGQKFLSRMLSAGGPISNAYADFLLNPNLTKWHKFLELLPVAGGAVGGAMATQPQSDQATTATGQ